VIFGTVFFRGELKKIGLNTWRDSIANGKQVTSALFGLRPGSRGANMVMGIPIEVKKERKIADIIFEADDTAIEDRLFRDALGLEAHVNLDLRARVDTPDNRYDSWRQWMKAHRGQLSVESIYKGQVGRVDYEATPPV
jgi:hypothetical protein